MPIRPPKGFIEESDPRVSQIGHPAPPWLVNYADLMTELVCFFIILYALSAALNKNIQNAAQQVREMIEKKTVTGDVKVDREGLHITLQEQGRNVFFQSGSAELTPEMETLMDRLAPVLRQLVGEHEILVEGHTDDIPIRNDLYQSNWELSTARATNVVQYVAERHALAPARLGATGYGEHRPIVPNDTPENRSKNRRVVFFVKNSPIKPQAAASPRGGEGAGPRTQEKEERASGGGALRRGLERVLSRFRSIW